VSKQRIIEVCTKIKRIAHHEMPKMHDEW